MTSDRQTFTPTELERMLDWYRALSVCHDVVPPDYELADKIAFQIATQRVRRVSRPSE